MIDDTTNPNQIVYGDRGSRVSDNRDEAAKFPWIEVREHIERVSLSLLPEALKANDVHEEGDRLTFSNQVNGGSLNYSGTLFSGLTIAPVHGSDAAGVSRVNQIKRAPGWLSVSGGCRFKPFPPLASLAGLGTYSERRTLLRDGEVWSADGSPHQGEPTVMYSTHEQAANQLGRAWFISFYSEPSMRMVHSVEWKGMSCRNINVPAGAMAGVLEFQDGTLASLFPSGSIAVLKP